MVCSQNDRTLSLRMGVWLQICSSRGVLDVAVLRDQRSLQKLVVKHKRLFQLLGIEIALDSPQTLERLRRAPCVYVFRTITISCRESLHVEMSLKCWDDHLDQST
jgi:hypothetical protein